jgi:hypothetical protein
MPVFQLAQYKKAALDNSLILLFVGGKYFMIEILL